MRIIAGHYKNRRINFTKLDVRPTTDFAKESLFNLLGNYYRFHNISALDLFAGSGNISYEFVSRGAKKTLAIEHNVNCVKFIKQTKNKLNMDSLEVKISNVYKYLQKTSNNYDVIFADPPYQYNQDYYDKIIALVFNRNLLKPFGTLVIEHTKFINFKNNLFFFDHRKYGKVNFTFLKNEK
tara:strand:- start:1084 stop:1626 length:543 start_codon:yes stop_codon:yes gene_type:complete